MLATKPGDTPSLTSAVYCTKPGSAYIRVARQSLHPVAKRLIRLSLVAAGAGSEVISEITNAYHRLKDSKGTAWIVKPGGKNRGNGILIMSSIEEIVGHLKKERCVQDCFHDALP